MLNLMQRTSGIATLTSPRYVDEIKVRLASKILDTLQDTFPAFASSISTRSGAAAERITASISPTGILIKNNHITLGGGIEKVLTRARERRKPGQTIDIEVRNRNELAPLALDNGAESLLLDNMTPADVKKSVEFVRERGLKILIEASGSCITSRTSVNTFPRGSGLHFCRRAHPFRCRCRPLDAHHRGDLLEQCRRRTPHGSTTPSTCRSLDVALAGSRFAGNLHFFPSIHSTNTHAMQQAESGAPDGSVYFADEQTAGRGRSARPGLRLRLWTLRFDSPPPAHRPR